MSTKPINLCRYLLVLATCTSLVSCGVFGDDSERYERLDRLRVLAIRSDPPDLRVGETATLSANVFEPDGRELSYEWSWCPSRADASASFECNISEQDLQRAWAVAGLEGSAPSYDLGTESEAQLSHLLTPELVSALCQAPVLDERVKVACFEGLEASVRLRIQTSDKELTAIKSVTLRPDEAPDSERNSNPASGFGLTLRDNEGDVVVEADQPLRAGHRYRILADVEDEAAESFTPEARSGEPPPKERRETLIMTWFITVGELVAPEGDDTEAFGQDRERTTFVDGSNDVEDMLKNGWQLPLTAGSSAQLHVVLRDERGGVGWTARSFDVVGGEK